MFKLDTSCCFQLPSGLPVAENSFSLLIHKVRIFLPSRQRYLGLINNLNILLHDITESSLSLKVRNRNICQKCKYVTSFDSFSFQVYTRYHLPPKDSLGIDFLYQRIQDLDGMHAFHRSISVTKYQLVVSF